MNAIEERILECFPSASYALAALLRLLDIVESDSVPTAAVECRIQPRLLINPGFAEKHAATPEQLLMLVMHELHHVLLGHTTLFETTTATDNFVFDCVINALISRMFPQPEHLRFLTGYYSDRAYPECLLRPPAKWNGRSVTTLPRAIRELPPKRRDRVAELYRSLYSEAGVTYEEVREVFPGLLDEDDVAAVPLVGGHGADGTTKGDFNNGSPVILDVVRSVVEEWPRPPEPIRGCSLAELLHEAEIAARRVPDNRALLRALLWRIGDRGTRRQMRRMADDTAIAPTPLPRFDRRSVVLRALGTRQLLYAGGTTLRRLTAAGEKVHVYVDVSGSMDGIKGAVYGAVIDCREWVHPRIHLFSNRVCDASLAEIRKGIVRTSGGTDIACVAEHMVANKVRRACIITDGWVGMPRGGHLETLARARLGVAWIGDTINTHILSGVANRSVTLTI